MQEEDLKYKKINKIRKIIMIVVVCLLILWLILFISFSKKNYEPNNIDTNINNNIAKMEDAARKYFTNDLINTNEDSKMSVSLKKLYEKELLEKLKTSDNNECIDTASYALLYKQEDGYKLDTILVCNDTTSKITSYFDKECGLSCDKISNIEDNK